MRTTRSRPHKPCIKACNLTHFFQTAFDCQRPSEINFSDHLP
ncbi:hypothetical protein TW90_1852 [Neisseria flavescens]|nr:hypothetical protein TW90_1852 [Neisseria flavescens]